ncbi:MAG: hypothetical protein HC808_20665, partial [Candidatus Competibacteraceae bacterium]|nr:hypothetical protein [Candidatus Competibacteraceae bacterium]
MTISWRVSLLGWIILVTACAVSPTGRQQLALLPAQQLDAMGAESFAKLKQSKPLETDKRINNTVRCVVWDITAGIGGGQWEVAVFRDKIPMHSPCREARS